MEDMLIEITEVCARDFETIEDLIAAKPIPHPDYSPIEALLKWLNQHPHGNPVYAPTLTVPSQPWDGYNQTFAVNGPTVGYLGASTSTTAIIQTGAWKAVDPESYGAMYAQTVKLEPMPLQFTPLDQLTQAAAQDIAEAEDEKILQTLITEGW